jgi:murein L,D-transpeptidase YafK
VQKKSVSNNNNWQMLKKIIFFAGGLILFLTGCVIYGIILNLRENTLQEEMTRKGLSSLKNVNIEICRSKYELNLYSDTILVKTYKAVFGRDNTPKTTGRDKATPIGEYKICSIDTNHEYRKFLRLNYPNLNDAEEGLRKELITQKEYEQIRFEYYYGACTNDKTMLGGNIGIHGIGELNFIFKNLPFIYNWTDGSIAVSNESIDEIYSVAKEGTKVVIKR